MSTRRQKSGTRRTQIIQAALACFTEQGYTRATLAHIRRHSTASTGSIYHHFTNKEQLAAAVYLEGIRSYQEGLLQVVAREKRAREGILAIVRYHLRWVREQPDWARFLVQMRHAEFMAGTDESFRNLNQKFAQGLSDWVRERMRQGSLRRVAPDVFIAVLLGPCQEYVRLWLAGQTVTEPEAAAKEIAGSAWRALRGSAEFQCVAA